MSAWCRTGSGAPIALPPSPVPGLAPDRGVARIRSPSAAAAIAARQRWWLPGRPAASQRRSPRRVRCGSSQRQPSFDRLARDERELNSYRARQIGLAGERPNVAPLPAAGEIRQMKLRDVGDQWIRSRLRIARAIVARPVNHLDGPAAEIVGDSLPGASRFERELGACARELERAVARRVLRSDPCCCARLAEPRGTRHRLTEVALEPREKTIERLPSVRLRRE